MPERRIQMRRILACHDGSEEATQGVAEFLRSGGEVADLTLFHVLAPVPPSLLEHEGSENPHGEERLAERLRERRTTWIRDKLEEANQAFRPILSGLRTIGKAENRVSLKLLPAADDEDFFTFLRGEVSSGEYDDVVIAHRSHSWLRNLLKRCTLERVKQELEGLEVRIVELSA
jgi:hypothetical protein